MPDDEPINQPEPSPADQRAFELFRRVILLDSTRNRATLLSELNNTLFRRRLAVVQTNGGRKYG